MIYPKKNRNILQQNGSTGETEMALVGGERIYSQEDTQLIVSLAKKAKTDRDFMKLGETVLKATETQDLNQK